MDTLDQFLATISLLQQNLHFMLLLIGCLYCIHIINWAFQYRLNYLGIYPRKVWGLAGIVFSPFLHGNFNHLFFNSIPLFVLASFVLLNGMPAFICASVTIIVLGGIGTWLFARSAFHIGASGLIMGYWAYLLLYAYKNPTTISIALAVVCVYYFGGLVLGLFPIKVKVSWEAHLFGFLAGLAAAYGCPLFFTSFEHSVLSPLVH